MAKETKEKEKHETKHEAKAGKLVAKMDFCLCHGDLRIEIKTGDDLSEVPEMFYPGLRTEGVL